MLKKWFKKGRRVRYWHIHLKKVKMLVMLMPFFLLSIFFGYRLYVEVVYLTFGTYYILMLTSFVLNIIGIIVFFKGKWFTKIKDTWHHRQKMARLIVHHNYYIEKTINKRRKIVYFPKVYYKRTGRILDIRFPLDMGKFQEQFLKMEVILESGLSGDIKNVFREKDFIVYQVVFEPLKARINIKDMIVNKREIQLMDGLFWNFASVPHFLITGGTGSGKTFTMQTLIYGFCQLGAKVRIADPKMADLSFLEYSELFSKSVVYETTTIANAISKFAREMDERMVRFRELAKGKTGLNYYDFDELVPQVLVIDELNSYLDSLGRDFNKTEQVLKDMSRVIMLGRQCGFFLGVGMQRPDANYLPNGMRDNFGLRIGLGKMSDSGYNMLFGDEKKDYISLEEKGFGYAFCGYGRVFQFFSPLVEKDFEFVEQFNVLFDKKKIAQLSQ